MIRVKSVGREKSPTDQYVQEPQQKKKKKTALIVSAQNDTILPNYYYNHLHQSLKNHKYLELNC